MVLRLAVLKSVFSSYNRYAFPLIFLFIGIFFLLKKTKKEQQNLLIYEIFGILLLVTPFIGNKIVTIGAGGEANWPVYGILCIVLLTAYMLVEILKETSGKKGRIGMLIALLAAVWLSFGFSTEGDGVSLPGANQKLSKASISLGELLEKEEQVYVMAPMELASDLREYSEKIHVFCDESYEGMQNDLSLLQREAEYYGCNYIILNAVYDKEEAMTAGGYGERICVDNYVIYEKTSGLHQ